MTSASELSYSNGASAVPLLGETIGDNLRRIAAHVRRPRGAGRRAHRAPLDLRRVRRRRRRARPRPARALGIAGRRPGRHLGARTAPEWVLVQYATAKVGAILVNINPAYRTPRAGVRAAPVRRSRLLVSADGVQDQRLPGDGRRGPRRPAPRCEQVVYLGDAGVGRAARRRARPRGARARWPQREAGLAFDDPINIQYTVGHHRLPQGRDAVPPQHPQQRLLHRRGLRLHRADRVCIPVPFYHCFGMVLGNLGLHHARRLHGHPGAGVRPGRDAARRCRRSAARRCTACRRCSSPSSGLPRLRRATTCPRCAPGSWPARRARSR